MWVKIGINDFVGVTIASNDFVVLFSGSSDFCIFWGRGDLEYCFVGVKI